MKKLLHAFPILLALVFFSVLFQCKEVKNEDTSKKSEDMTEDKIAITQSEFGKTKDGLVVNQYTLKNRNGVEMNVINYGGRITSLKVPNKSGEFENVILGFDNLEAYEADNPFFGALIGR